MEITKNFKYFFILPLVVTLLSLLALFVWGLKPGIDLAGGSLLQVSYPAGRPSVETVREKVSALGLGEVRVQPVGKFDYILRQRDLTIPEKDKLLQPLRNMGEMEEVQFTSIGPSLGAELLRKAWIAIVLVVL